jgi:hypothetical protein
MNGRFIRTTIIVVALFLAGSAWAAAQAPSVNVEFRFVAAGKTMNAGTYAVDIAPSGNVVLTAEQGGAAIEIPETKKLHERTIKRAELVFDVVGSARFLAEVRLPGKGAFVVGRHADAQEQETVSGPKPAK